MCKPNIIPFFLSFSFFPFLPFLSFHLESALFPCELPPNIANGILTRSTLRKRECEVDSVTRAFQIRSKSTKQQQELLRRQRKELFKKPANPRERRIQTTENDEKDKKDAYDLDFRQENVFRTWVQNELGRAEILFHDYSQQKNTYALALHALSTKSSSNTTPGRAPPSVYITSLYVFFFLAGVNSFC
jgi:hypothetical protein